MRYYFSFDLSFDLSFDFSFDLKKMSSDRLFRTWFFMKNFAFDFKLRSKSIFNGFSFESEFRINTNLLFEKELFNQIHPYIDVSKVHQISFKRFPDFIVLTVFLLQFFLIPKKITKNS